MRLLPFSRYKISGHSMEPILKEGEVVWVNNWSYLFSKPKVGDIIVFRFQNRELIKRISQVRKNMLEVVGDNRADSLDSTQFGQIDLKTGVVGKVLHLSCLTKLGI